MNVPVPLRHRGPARTGLGPTRTVCVDKMQLSIYAAAPWPWCLQQSAGVLVWVCCDCHVAFVSDVLFPGQTIMLSIISSFDQRISAFLPLLLLLLLLLDRTTGTRKHFQIFVATPASGFWKQNR